MEKSRPVDSHITIINERMLMREFNHVRERTDHLFCMFVFVIHRDPVPLCIANIDLYIPLRCNAPSVNDIVAVLRRVLQSAVRRVLQIGTVGAVRSITI